MYINSQYFHSVSTYTFNAEQAFTLLPPHIMLIPPLGFNSSPPPRIPFSVAFFHFKPDLNYWVTSNSTYRVQVALSTLTLGKVSFQ